MHPTIRNGETIRVESVLPAQIKRGDIVLYRWERGIRAHRVVRIVAAGKQPVFLLRSDGGGDDELIPASQVLGKVVAVERSGRSVPLCGAIPKLSRTLRRCVSSFKRLIESGWRSKSRPSPLGLQGDY